MAIAVLAVRHQFSAASYGIRVNSNGWTETLNFVVVANQDYFATGNGEVDDYITIFETVLNGNTGGVTYTVTLLDSGLLHIAASGDFQILWDDVATTIDSYLFGYDVDAKPDPPNDDFTSPYVCKGLWVPDQDFFRTNYGDAEIVGGLEIAISGSTVAHRINADSIFWDLRWIFINKAYIKTRFGLDLTGDNAYNTIEYLRDTYGLGDGCAFRFYEKFSDRDLLAQKNVTLRLLKTKDIWKLESEQRLTSFAVQLLAVEV